MADRGVTRPGMGHETRGRGEHEHHRDGESGERVMDHGAPYSQRRYEMVREQHGQTLWVYWTILLLGVWQACAPFTFGYLNESLWVDPSGGRGTWFSPAEVTHTELRAWLMAGSDLASGIVLLIFGWRSLRPNRPVSLWICCFIGMWLTFAPVVLWAPTEGGYISNTIVGMLLIALTVLIPDMPNMMLYMEMGEPTPRGWSYNPSSWPQRWIMIALGFAGFIVSRYLATYQLGYIDKAWDPFFGESTRHVLDSKMSHMWPISDAGLGTIAYTFEFLMGYMGSRDRWRTMPWMVAFFGFLVIPLGLTHIILVISQPLVVGEWCTFCLLAAAIMLPMIPLEVDEVIAMGQHLVEANRRGDHGGGFRGLWITFWKGGSAEGCEPDERSPEMAELADHPGRVLASSIWGISFPWTLTISTALGIWLMLTPWALNVGKPASDVFHLAGALIVVMSVISMGEVLRLGRHLNIPLGFGVAIAPWFFTGGTIAASIIAAIAGSVVAVLALPRGPKHESYGLWDQYVR